jgi:hypothetical protein
MVAHKEARDAAAQETRTVAGPDDRVDLIVPKGRPGDRGRIDGPAKRRRMPRREERVMTSRDQAEGGRDQDRTGQPNLEELFEQGQVEAHRQAMEAAALARAHYEIEPGLRVIYRLESPDASDLRIKLLEVNEQTVPTGIVPVGFPPHPASGLHFPSVVIEVTPKEYEAITRKQLHLPSGWEVRESYERPRPEEHAGSRP